MTNDATRAKTEASSGALREQKEASASLLDSKGKTAVRRKELFQQGGWEKRIAREKRG